MRFLTIVLLILPAGTLADEKSKKKDSDMSDEEKGVLELTNAERKSEGVPALKPNARLLKAAREHAANMARQDKLEHILDGKSYVDRVKATGYPLHMVGENIAHGSQNPEQVIKLWMDSPGHKMNLLRKEFTEIGIGLAVNEKGEKYWVQVFGRPR